MPDPNESTRRIAPPGSRVGDGPGSGEPIVGSGRLDRYVLMNRLGSGSSAAVYRAFDPELGREVAIKLLQNRSGSTPAAQAEMSARLLREARAIATLAHPNVVTVYDVGAYTPEEIEVRDPAEDEAPPAGGVFIVMEIVDGIELGRWSLTGRRAWREIRDVFLAAGEGLAAAHDAGLVHRDFKPANVVLGHDGRVRVLDFGLVRSTRPDGLGSGPLASSGSGSRAAGADDESVDMELTLEGSVMGTPAYMAPEQHDGAPADARADVFAFCTAFWEALYGKRPFAGGSYDELARSKRGGRIAEPPGDRRAPRWLRRSIERGLAADPAQRPQSMRVLLDELRRVPRRRRRVMLGVAAVGVTGAVMLGVGLRDRARAEAACGEAVESLAGVWDRDTPQMIERAFVGTGAANGAEAARLVASALDAYAESWSSARRRACVETVAQGAESVEVLGRRMSCLDLRREQMRELVGVLLAPDATVVRRAGEAVSDLPPPSTCVAEAAAAQMVDDVETERIVNAAATLARAGLFEGALSAANEAIANAQRAGDDAAQAHALIVVASAQGELGKYQDAESSLHAAQVAAERAGRGDLVTRAQVQLVGVVGFRLGRHDEATRLAEQVDARLVRHRRDGSMPQRRRLELEGDLAHGRSLVLIAQGRYAKARDSFLRTLGLRKQAFGEDHPRVARSLMALGTVSNTLGEYDRGHEYLRAALGMYERHLGPSHPEVGVTLLNLANNLRLQVRPRQGLAEVARAKALWSDAVGEEHIRVAQVVELEASLLADAGRFEEAEAGFAAASELYAKLGAPVPMSATVTEELGFLRLRQGKAAEAEELFASYQAAMEGALGKGHPAMLDGLIGLGIARVELGDTGGARSVLALAREIQDRAGTLATDAARIDFAMARAIAGEEPERARELAVNARAVFRDKEDLYGHLPEIEALLGELGGDG